MLAGISFLNVVVGSKLLVTLSVTPLPLSAGITVHEEMQYFTCLHSLEYGIYYNLESWISQFTILSSYLARALFRVFVIFFTTVVINCKLGYIDSHYDTCQQNTLKYATNVGYIH